MTTTIVGYGIGRGIALGPAIVQEESRQVVPRYYITADKVAAEAERLTRAFEDVDVHLTDLKRKLKVLPNRDPYLILEAHQALLKDRSFRDASIERVQRQRVNAEWSLEQTIRDIRQVFESVGDDYIRQRLDDILNLRDLVAERLLAEIPTGVTQPTTVLENAILVASDLTPHATLQAIRSGVRGLALEGGSANGHAAIIARSMGVPMIVGAVGLLSHAVAGQQLALDARSGEIFIAPAADTVRRITEQSIRELQQAGAVWHAAAGPALLRDGTIIAVLGNVDLPEELGDGKLDAIDGIGLFRTEIPFLGMVEPTEDELESQYSAMLSTAADRSVVFRVLDLGGDKTPGAGAGYGPLGLRGIRHLFANEDLFRRQLRAILRASVRAAVSDHGADRDILLLLPMLTSAHEVRRARSVIERVAASLNVPMRRIKIGAMIETPAAALVVDQIRREADYLSIGSNDLIQYVLAVDRNDPDVADIFDPLHPAVLRLLRSIVDAAADTPLTVCGEIAADLRLVPLLIGMGVRSLSMPVPYVPTIKPALRAYGVKECKTLLKNCLEADSAAELKALVEVFVRSHAVSS